MVHGAIKPTGLGRKDGSRHDIRHHRVRSRGQCNISSLMALFVSGVDS